MHKLGDTFYLLFPTHDATGALSDADATPVVEVFEDASDSAMAYLPPVAKVGAYTGYYRATIVATGANGFEVGKSYNFMAAIKMDGTNIASRIDVILSLQSYDNDDLKTVIGAPVALDSGTASIAGMLVKMADDNGGADFDATTDSLEKIAAAISGGSFTVADIWAYLVTGLEPAGSAAALLAAAASGGSGDIINQIVIPMSKTRNELLSTTVDVADRIAGHGNIVAASSYVIMFSRDGRITTSDMIRSVTYNADSVDLIIRRGAYSDSPYKLLIMLWMDSNAWIRVECELVVYRALD